MKTIKVLLLTIALLAPAFGQTTATSTTLAAAITTPTSPTGGGITSNLVTLTSATGVTLPTATTSGSLLYVDQEAMQVTALVTGTTYSVVRGIGGSRVSPHANGQIIWVGNGAANQGPYHGGNPPESFCTANLNPYLPWINLVTGELWNCGNSIWTKFDGTTWTAGATLSSATTIAPTNPYHVVSGTTAIATITVPPAMPPYGGCIALNPSGVWATTTAGNIAIIATAVVNRVMTMCYNPATAKWYPSYV